MVVVVALLFPHDLALLKILRVEGGKHPVLKPLSDTVASWGSLAQINLAVTGGVWLVGWLMKSRYWQRLALVTAVSCILAGLACNLFRPTLARPRPRVVMVSQPTDVDRFYGVERTFRGANYHGFPSGHTATTFGTLVPLMTAGPPWLAVPAAGMAGLMGWSRMYQRAHYPADVLMGATLGILFGVAGSWHLRQVRRRLGGRRGRGERG